MKFLIPAGILLCCSLWKPACTQVESGGGIIIPLPVDKDAPQLVPVAGKGLVVVREIAEDEAGETRSWEINFYDVDLTLVWHTVIKMNYYLTVTQHTSSDKEIYLVFEGIKNLKRLVQIFKMNLSDRSFRVFEIKNFTPSSILKFAIFGNALVIGGMNNGKPSIVLYKYADDRPVVLQGLYSNKFDLIDIDVDNHNELLTVLISYRNISGQYCIGVHSYDQEGHSVENVTIEPPGDLELMEGITRIVNGTYHIVAGTYRQIKSSYIDGLFISCLNINGESKTGYYDLYTLYGIPKPADSTETAAFGLPDNPRLKMQWVVTGISSLQGKPVILSEAFQEVETRSMGITPQTLIYYNYKRGLVTFLDEGYKPVKSHEINMEGLVLENILTNLFILPSDTVPKIGYFDFTALAYASLKSDRTFPDRHYVSLTEISGLNSGTISFIHKYLGFIPWYGRNYLFYGIRSDKSAEPVNNKAMFIQKIVFK